MKQLFLVNSTPYSGDFLRCRSFTF